MKGVEMTVNTVIIIVLSLLALAVLTIFLLRGYGSSDAAFYESAVMQGCKEYVLNPEGDVATIDIGDVNNDGTPDTLLSACRAYLGKPSLPVEECEDLCRSRYGMG
ncbi:MAG: hypothetical protein ACP5E4_04330 [Candidatus Aenigmatarchaeota archaeon]